MDSKPIFNNQVDSGPCAHTKFSSATRGKVSRGQKMIYENLSNEGLRQTKPLMFAVHFILVLWCLHKTVFLLSFLARDYSKELPTKNDSITNVCCSFFGEATYLTKPLL